MIQIYTGDGKGKTTASMGLVLRAVGAGMKVAVIAFDKGGETHYSERKTFAERFPEVDFHVTGLDRIDPQSGRFRFGVTEDDKREGERGLGILKELLEANKHNLIILDEINSSTNLGIIDEQIVLELLKQKHETIELVLTGRNAPTSFIELADLVTEMKMRKHYFYHGTKAREGLDY